MFKFLKEKIGNWVKKVASHEEKTEKVEQKIQKTKAVDEFPKEEKKESFLDKIKSKIQKIKIS